jgi:hypothetical protein
MPEAFDDNELQAALAELSPEARAIVESRLAGRIRSLRSTDAGGPAT